MSSYLVIHTTSLILPELHIICGSDNLILGKFIFLQNNTVFNNFSSSSLDIISCLLLNICFGIIIVNN